MLRIIPAMAMLALGQMANAQLSETRDIPPFTKLEITGGVEVVYTQGEHTALKIETADEPGFSGLETTSVDGTLSIRCNENDGHRVKVYLSTPEMLSVKAGKKARFIMTRPLYTNVFSASLASGATFFGIVKSKGVTRLKAQSGTIFNIRAETSLLVANFQNNAKVNLSGISETAFINTMDEAFCNARNLITKKVSVNAKDYSTILASATKDIAVDVVDDATVKYYDFLATR